MHPKIYPPSQQSAQWVLTVARLLLHVRLETGFALASAGGQIPLAVALAQVHRRIHLFGVVHAPANRLLDHRHLAPRRCGGEVREIDRHRRTRNIVDLKLFTQKKQRLVNKL